MDINSDEIAVTACTSPYDPPIGAHIGVKIRHLKLDIEVTSTDQKSQHKNHMATMEKPKSELAKFELVKSRFEDIDEDDLMDGETFWNELNSGKYDQVKEIKMTIQFKNNINLNNQNWDYRTQTGE
jgi:protein subunit release factor B